MWADRIARALLVGVGLVNLAPGAAALSASRVESLYGVRVGDADLELLLRHRAALLAIVGGGLLAGTFVPSIRVPTVAAAATSMGSYVALTAAVGPTNPQSSRVRAVDVGALAALAVAVGLGSRSLRPAAG
ncbi:hypothetical protein FCG67_22725 [Rhodococcus oryzae]|uniref:Phosphopantetheine adenylyltransferase n=1 Tax=Rhodococcus oryzae TaxID=2571143 RepID=A0ABY2REA9_9NOCA|nr:MULTISPECIES: hypothetical protein [Rhodococcus]AQA22399.1 putative membrane protein [Rhodococcus sp. MTM3W5.2]TJZ74139.1 hypothetical protein FCG67_22725 [Rhodococcus oryzae]